MYNREWIIEKAVPIVEAYRGNLTKKVVAAMEVARWENLLSFNDFLDHERTTLGETKYQKTDVESEVEHAREIIRYIAVDSYKKNRWENQETYVEVFIEKKALQGVFEKPCKRWDVALSACKGYPSLTFQNDAAQRLRQAEEKKEYKRLIKKDIDNLFR